MNLKTFKKIANQVAELEKAKIKFQVAIRGDGAWNSNESEIYFEPTNYEVTTLNQLSQIQAITGRAIDRHDSSNSIKIDGLNPVPCVKNVYDFNREIQDSPGIRLKVPTFKFYSETGRDTWYNFAIEMISEEPSQQIEEDITYRYIGDKNCCLFCIPHTHKLYNYLDKGFFFCRINKVNEREKVIIANELTLDTYLVMLLVWLQPNFAKQLAKECYINANTAKLLRIKFEKELAVQFKPNYDKVRDACLKEYEKVANSNLLTRVAERKVPHATYNHIRFTADSATYETISLEAEGMLATLQATVAFDDRTDIYSIIRDYIRHVISQLEEEDLNEAKAKVVLAEPVPTGDAVADKLAMDAYLSSLAEEVKIEYKFSINKLPITLSRTTENTRRRINDVMINKIEVEDVAFQASCYESNDDYVKFVKSVSKMSLKWHNALANGIPVKINSSLSADDYKKPEAPNASPRIKFTKDEKDFKLVLGENETVKIKFNDCLAKLATLNRKTNNLWQPTAYGRRDYNWAKRELVKILKECCTFETKTIPVTETEEPVMKDGKQVTDDDGNLLFKKIKTKGEMVITKECLLTDEQAAFVGKMAEEFQVKALAKSQKFLADAIRNTQAKLIDFQGEKGYLVEGKLRKYVVMQRTNQVMNYETRGHICIVETGHQVSIGGDATAARLYALRNDSVMTNQIGTLRHG